MELWDSDRARLANSEQTELLQELHKFRRKHGWCEPEELYFELCDRLPKGLAIALHGADHKFFRLIGQDDVLLGYLLAIEFQGQLPQAIVNGQQLLLHHAFEFEAIQSVTISWVGGTGRFTRRGI